MANLAGRRPDHYHLQQPPGLEKTGHETTSESMCTKDSSWLLEGTRTIDSGNLDGRMGYKKLLRTLDDRITERR
eukprot:1083600-Amphidinium_carterae.1